MLRENQTEGVCHQFSLAILVLEIPPKNLIMRTGLGQVISRTWTTYIRHGANRSCVNALFIPPIRYFTPFVNGSSTPGSDCKGCGALVQSRDHTKAGYVPEAAWQSFNNGWKKRASAPAGVAVHSVPDAVEVAKANETKYRHKAVMLYCQRCFRLQNYRDVPPLSNPVLFGRTHPDAFSHPDEIVEHLVKSMKKESVVLKIVDILDFESSLVPELYEALSRRSIPVITVLNKIDCLPLERRNWKGIIGWSERVSKVLRSAVGNDGKKDVVLVSSTNELGFDSLETRLSQYMSSTSPKTIYVVGRVNSGKSTFVTRFLRYIGFKHMGCVHYKRGVGGITRSPIPSTTLDFVKFALPKGCEIVDTPGVTTPFRITSHLSIPKDFIDVSPGQRLQPVTYAVKEDRSLLLGAMCRIEVASGASALMTCFISPKVTVHICNSANVTDFMKRKAGTFLYPPHITNPEDDTHTIVQQDWVKHKVQVYCGPSVSHDDIVVAGLGWIAVYGQGHKEIDVWVPKGVKVFRRPSMIPKFIQATGANTFHFRNRARSLRVNKQKKELIRSIRVVGKKERWRESTKEDQEMTISPPSPDSGDSPLVTANELKQFNIVS